jgi:hypothetical protein
VRDLIALDLRERIVGIADALHQHPSVPGRVPSRTSARGAGSRGCHWAVSFRRRA